MATLEECEQALLGLVEKLAAVDHEVRSKHVLERTIACRVTDLEVLFRGRLADEGLLDFGHEPDPGGRPDAQVRLTAASDDLVALAEGRLPVPTAWATGRLKVEASVFDLLKLRTLL